MLNVSESNGYVPWIARSCAGLTMVFDLMSLRRLARSYSTRAVSLAEQVQDPAALAKAHHAAAHHAWLAGQWDGALERMASERSPRLVKPEYCASESTAAWVVASILHYPGDAQRALAVGEGLVRIGDEKADLEARRVGAGRWWVWRWFASAGWRTRTAVWNACCGAG